MIEHRLTSLILSPSLILCAGLLLSGCGIKGSLDTPPPIWGDKTQTAQPVTPDTDSNTDIGADTDPDTDTGG